MPRFCIHYILSLWLLAGGMASGSEAEADNWPQWRGVDQVGRSTTAKGLPTTWTKTENVVWRVELPSWSAATPIIWEDYVFITSAEEGFNELVQMGPRGEGGGSPGEPGQRRRGNARPPSNEHDQLFLLALDRKDGSMRWKREPDLPEAHHGVTLAGDGRQARLGDDRGRRADRVRFCR